MAYDSATQQVVLFGGKGTHGPLSTTWAWNGTKWTKVAVAASTGPPAAVAASMAYDSAANQLVLFGGEGASGPISTTWTWSGTNWTKAATAKSPTARSGAATAYDPATQQVVLFGGKGTHGPLSTTWAWNGAGWQEVATSVPTGPPALVGASMAYDTAAKQLVLFGGRGVSGPLATTWTWNGANWTKAVPKTTPPAATAAAMAYDPTTQDVVLFGGRGVSGPLATTWTWSGTNWTKATPTPSPPSRSCAAMAGAPADTSGLLLFGGRTDLAGTCGATAVTASATASATASEATTDPWLGTTWEYQPSPPPSTSPASAPQPPPPDTSGTPTAPGPTTSSGTPGSGSYGTATPTTATYGTGLAYTGTTTSYGPATGMTSLYGDGWPTFGPTTSSFPTTVGAFIATSEPGRSLCPGRALRSNPERSAGDSARRTRTVSLLELDTRLLQAGGAVPLRVLPAGVFTADARKVHIHALCGAPRSRGLSRRPVPHVRGDAAIARLRQAQRP